MKSAVSRKTKNRLAAIKRRARAIQSYEISTQVRFYAEAIPSQAVLDTCLLQEPDAAKRQKMFDFMKTWLKFPDPHCPSTIEQSRIIAPFPQSVIQ